MLEWDCKGPLSLPRVLEGRLYQDPRFHGM